MLLVIANIAAITFALTEEKGAWKVSSECVAIIVSFVVAAILMEWMYNTFGYGRLLGMAPLVARTPAFVYALKYRKGLSFSYSR